MKEALSSSEASVLTRATLCNIPEDGILHFIYLEEEINAFILGGYHVMQFLFHPKEEPAEVISQTLSHYEQGCSRDEELI
jgi:hypothetical protein